MVRSLIVLLIVGAMMVSGHPARMLKSRRFSSLKKDTVATVDCSDREAVKFVLQSHANFRCTSGTIRFLAEIHGIKLLLEKLNYKKQFSGVYRYLDNSLDAEDSVNFAKEKYTFACPDKKVFSPIAKRCVYPNWNRPSGFTDPKNSKLFPAGLTSASLVKSVEPQCEEGFLYSPDVNLCLAAHKPLSSVALQSDSLVIDNPVLEIRSFSYGPNSADDCPQGTLFNSELNICSEISSSNNLDPLPALSLVKENSKPPALEIRSFASDVQSADDCKPGEIYAADVNLCVDMSPRPAISSRMDSPPLQSASLVKRQQPTNPPLVTARDCKPDEIYVSEVGICVQRRGSRPRKPISDSLVRVNPAPSVPRVAVEEKTSCPPGHTFNPSISACLPLSSSSNNPTPPPSQSLIKEPLHLEIESSQDTITEEDCLRRSKIFVAELGICM